VKLTTHLHLVPHLRTWSYTSASLYVFLEWYLVNHRDNLAFTFNIELVLSWNPVTTKRQIKKTVEIKEFNIISVRYT